MKLRLTIFRHRAPSITRERVRELQYEALCSRTARRQREAKEALVRRGVLPCTPISTGYVPPSIARVFTHSNVRGLA
ncbi:hypothetical protein [Paraburkholderia tagetis]|uniref:Uncharacterized protein n=1 Tax=Paraburkholderia tagetis TaxID=2913261 RepID=A0A9X1RG22_9BURK|nr:hypothetical protein [Paraburkholderia tagetis]MCG5072241.1 hypothetical protein [Paraburkholderia tagetis]